ncbi:MAG: type I CRISPR-associated protein Cas7 [Bacilli bacterium]
MSKMNQRIYGVVGIKSIMSNWNADFTGKPKTTSNGDIFGSDKAFKYPIKKMWEMQGEKIIYIKSFKQGKDNVQARNLEERYNYVFGKEIKNIKQKEEVIKDLFSAVDVMNFGATFAQGGNNISITGSVQIRPRLQ